MNEELLKIYPINLVMAVFRNPDQAIQCNIDEVEETLQTLTEREQKVLMLRFQEK